MTAGGTTSCCPCADAAWPAGALLGVLLDLEPVPQELTLRTTAEKPLPSWAGSMRLTGMRAFGLSWEARVEDHRVTVTEA